MKKILLVIAALLFAAIATAQPPRDQWAHTYGERLNDFFWDVYCTEEGNLACVGKKVTEQQNRGDAWLLVANEHGVEIINEVYGVEGVTERFHSLVEVDGGGFLMAGYSYSQPSDVFAVRAEADGEEIWAREYGGGGSDNCHAVIELKDGNFLLAGKSSSAPDSLAMGGVDGYLLKIDPDGEVIWERWYGSERTDCFFAMREVDDGILLAGCSNGSGWLLKTDEEGEIEYQRLIEEGRGAYQTFYSLISCRGGGFFAVGMSANIPDESWEWVVRFDEDGNPIWQNIYERDNPGYGYTALCVIQMPDEGFLFVGRVAPEVGWGGLMTRTDAAGNLMWSRDIPGANRGELDLNANTLFSVVITPEEFIVACGHGHSREDDGGGLLIKCVPERSAPLIIQTYPEELEFDILPGDTIQFDVDAVDLQLDSLFYVWELDGEEISTDTCVTVLFEEFGDFSTFVEVSDPELADSARWVTHVTEFYIDEFSPESSELEILRNSSVDFTHHTRTIEGLELEYRWEHFGRGGNFEFEGEDSIRFNFELTGEHIIRASVINNGEIETVAWDVNVRSIVWWWWPHDLALSVPVDTTMVFEVFPFNPESDSLEYTWFLNNEVQNGNASIIEILFSEIGEYEIIAYVQEGIEADTVRWTVGVQERSFTADDADLADLPTSLVLYPASPNPFNSTTIIRYFLPKAGVVTLKLFDIRGCLISNLTNKLQKAGLYTLELRADNLSAGVYLIQLQVNEYTTTCKTVVVK